MDTPLTHDTPPRLFPVLRYRDARAAIDWLVTALGFERQSVFDAPDGGIAHAELTFGTGVIGLSSAGAIDPAKPWTEVRGGIYLQVADVDRHHDRAAAAGAEIAVPLTNMDYGSRDYSLRDPEGHLWSVGSYAMATSAVAPDLFVGLHYRDPAAALAFLERAFGFTTLPSEGDVDATAAAESRFANDVVILSSALPPGALAADDRQWTHGVVSDPDAHCARAAAAGATIVQPVEETRPGARGYSARDPEGFVWSFSTYRPGR